MAFALLSKIKEFFVPVPLQSTLTKKEIEHIQFRLQCQVSKVTHRAAISISCSWGTHHFVEFEELHIARPEWLAARVSTLRDIVTKDMYGDTIIKYENTATQFLMRVQQIIQGENSPILKLYLVDQCPTNSIYNMQISTVDTVNSILRDPIDRPLETSNLWDYTITCTWGGVSEWNYRVIYSTAKPTPTEMNL